MDRRDAVLLYRLGLEALRVVGNIAAGECRVRYGVFLVATRSFVESLSGEVFEASRCFEMDQLWVWLVSV